MPEILSGDIAPFTKWTRVLAEMDNGSGQPKAWRPHRSRLQGLPPEKMARAVNRLVNGYAYIDDRTNWGKGDYWVTPAEFYAHGGGDCEDFAIVKYAWLRALGVPEDNMRLAVVYDVEKQSPHTVLVVRNGAKNLILDNQDAEVRIAENVTRYRPIFSINRYAWRLEEKSARRLKEIMPAGDGKASHKKGNV